MLRDNIGKSLRTSYTSYPVPASPVAIPKSCRSLVISFMVASCPPARPEPAFHEPLKGLAHGLDPHLFDCIGQKGADQHVARCVLVDAAGAQIEDLVVVQLAS